MSDTLATECIRRLALRPKEAARALGICERKLRELLPKLPHVRLGGAVVIPVDDLRAWLHSEAQAEKSRSDQIADEILEGLHRTEE